MPNSDKCGIVLQKGGMPSDGPWRGERKKVSDKIVNLFEIKPGGKVLDIATCIGEQPVTAAKKVKPDVKVFFLLIFALRCWDSKDQS